MKKISLTLAFTLAEILIVLTIIGVMAVMTIPSLIQNSNSQQKIALFKKAFNAVSNAYATEFALKNPPTVVNNKGKKSIYEALINQFDVKYYNIFEGIDNRSANATSTVKSYENPILNEERFNGTGQAAWGNFWIVTEDGISYSINGNTGWTIKSKLEVNNAKNRVAAGNAAALLILVDVIESNNKHIWCEDNEDLNNLKCDSLEFFVSKDGITSGNPDCTISGRIMSNNMEYDATKCQENQGN